MRTLPVRGMPPRGSLQDRIAFEMLVREQRKSLNKEVYHARINALGLGLPLAALDLWTSWLAMEISHENYYPKSLEAKQNLLRKLAEGRRMRSADKLKYQRRLETLVRDDDLTPATKTELEDFRRKLRGRHLKKATANKLKGTK